MEYAEVMVVGHAFFPDFGMKDDAQIPKDDFSEFVSDKLIILGPHYATIQPIVNQEKSNEAEQYIINNADLLNEFLAPIQGVAGFKDYIYRYMNYKAKQRQLDTIGDDFAEWLASSKISETQQQKIINRMNQYEDSVPIMFKMVKYMIELKNTIITQLGDKVGEITVSNAEGWVRYADDNKQFGNIKLVPRHEWLP
jgi:hypothetical protein